MFSVKICLYLYVVVLTFIYSVTMTERLKDLIEYGVSLGYKEDTLRECDKEKQKDELEYQGQKEKYNKEFKFQQITHQWQMELLQEKGKMKMGASDEVSVHPK